MSFTRTLYMLSCKDNRGDWLASLFCIPSKVDGAPAFI